MEETGAHDSDVLVIGSGIAGLTCALTAAEHGRVTVLAKTGLEETSTSWAQGGIAAAVSPVDSVEHHYEDTLATGAGLCHPEAVRVMVEAAPERIVWLQSLGVRFTMDSSSESPRLDLGKEAAHSHRRIVHAADLTGLEIQNGLVRAARASERITLLDRHFAVDLITSARLGLPGPDRCLGAYVLDRVTGRIETFRAGAVVLATGGAGKVYLYTTNPDVATGDGVAMAWRAGATVGNLEFYQFHPTCLYHPWAKSFLISEAVRGEGGVLRLRDGTDFMARYDPRGALAPRDVVARAIDREMKRTGDDCVFLDITHRDPGFVRGRFPNIHRKCLDLGIDITRQPIPVVPAAHYLCGGVVTDLEGRTGIPGLYAVGETAMTGVHGANRLASNSLLEGMVFGMRAGRRVADERGEAARAREVPVPRWDPRGSVPSDETVIVSHTWDEIRRLMWNYVGIFRSDYRLDRADRRISMIREEIKEYYWKFTVTPDLLELRNISDLAALVVRSARSRAESRGLHFSTTHPERDDVQFQRDTLMRREPGRGEGHPPTAPSGRERGQV